MPDTKPPAGYDSAGRLTLAGMRQKHAEGYSVIYNGVIIPPGSPLPTDAAIVTAGGNVDELAAAKEKAEAELTAKQKELEALTVAHKAAVVKLGPSKTEPAKK